MATIIDIPEDWPEHGELDGERIALADVGELSPGDRADVVVDVPDCGLCRPWRNVDDNEVYIADDGALVI